MRDGIAFGAVQPPLRQLRRCPGEIQLDRITCNRQLQRIAQYLAERIVPDLGVIDPVGQRADRGAHRLLGTGLHHMGERAQIVHAVLVHEAQQPLGAQRVGRDEGVDVAQDFLVLAHILGDQLEQVVVGHAGAVEYIGGIWMPSS